MRHREEKELPQGHTVHSQYGAELGRREVDWLVRSSVSHPLGAPRQNEGPALLFTLQEHSPDAPWGGGYADARNTGREAVSEYFFFLVSVRG